MTILFKAKTKEAYRIKILAEILANNIKTGCYVINDSGIFLCMMDSHRTILIDLKLNADDFTIYKFNTKQMHIGINLNHFHKMLRSIKKKDSIELFIDDSAPTDLGIKVIPKENNRVSLSSIKIQSVQNLEIDIPTGYTRPISVSSSDFQKCIKEMSSIGSVIKVTASKFKITFSCNAGNILKKSVSFGEEDDEDDEDTETSDSKIEFEQDFITEQLSRITKLSGLNANIQIYPGKPLKFNTTINDLGEIDIYIKSKQQIELENHNNGVIDSDFSDGE